MAGDEWWTQAVDEFGLDTFLEPTTSPAPVSITDPVAGGDDPTVPIRRRRRRLGVDWLVIAIVALGAAFLLRMFVVQQFAVDGQSMLGTLHSGDRVIVNKLSYDLHDPRHGDIVVLKDTEASLAERDLIKRVIGLPGETVEYRDCQLFINRARIAEPYLDPQLVSEGHCGDSQTPVEVAPRHVFVMGDNRAGSLDSRTTAIGQIPYDDLIGRAFVLIWPFSRWRLL
ncbi:MAG: signal peptidase I [Ilumatobacteraceae bacterium]|nr:signal peptidase I [Ilumatobacteraceae bacterium]